MTLAALETHLKNSIDATQARVDVWKAELELIEKKAGWYFKQEAASLKNRITHAETQIKDWTSHLNQDATPPVDDPPAPPSEK